MLNRTRRFVLAALPLAALALMTASGAAASDTAKTRANIPFAFDLNGQRFDAGLYIFECRFGTGLITVTPQEGERHAFLGRPLGDPSSAQDPKLVFYKVDDTYYLAELWLAGSGMGKGLPVKKEIEFSARRGDAKRIVVALSR
ncbi:MAG: hypothetical protein A2107_14545 [Verrucomicrobia bacterium GWF2_62_7]|nr:MAG: hypothetical protein A2107_14545 [Verrucomicrobia bacterium GWF2_62_7]